MREIVLLARQGFRLLTQRGRRVLLVYLVALIALATLDGIALFLISKLFSANLGSAESETASSSNITMLVLIICLFVSKSALSTFSAWLSVKELSKQEVELGQKRLQQLRKASLETRLELNETDFFTLIDRAPNSLVQAFLMSVVNVCAELITGLVILGVVLAIQPTTAVVALSYFALIAFVQHRFLSSAQTRAGQTILMSVNSTYELLADYFHLNKLLQISESKTFDSALRKKRLEIALARARQTFIASLPRHFMESMLALGFVVVSVITWWVEGESAVVPALVIFAAAGFRLLPIVNSIQALVLTVFGSAPLARHALTPITAGAQNYSQISISSPTDPSSVMEVVGVDFTYPSGKDSVLKDINLVFKDGLQYAIVGPSGSGKTTVLAC
jgi:ABC-type multidrug transport system fused ATPase/permease subunit